MFQVRDDGGSETVARGHMGSSEKLDESETDRWWTLEPERNFGDNGEHGIHPCEK